MDQPRKVAKPARGQLNREIGVLAYASVVRTYVLLFEFVYRPGIFFYLGTLIFVHGSLLYMHICMTTAVSVHIK